MAKVLIGVVTYGKQRYCLDEFVEALKKQTVEADVLFVVNNGESAYATLLRSMNLKSVEDPLPAKSRIEKIVNGRKYLRKHALDNGYDYLFFVDSDVMLLPAALDVLLKTKGDVIAGVYLNAFTLGGKTVIAPVVFKDLGKGNAQLYTYDGIAAAKVMDIGAAGFGCVLISKKVLEKVDIRAIGNNPSGGEDIAFFLDAREKGFKCVANTAVKCVHRPYPKEDKRSALFEWRRNVEDWTYQVNIKGPQG